MTSRRAETKDAVKNASGDGDGRAPDDPSDLKPRNWKQLLKRTVSEFRDDNLTDWAAALTYYAVLALFPALLVLTAVLGIFGQQNTIDTFIESMRGAGLSGAADNIEKPLEGVVSSKGGAGALLGFGLLGAIWSASGYLGAFIRASNAIYEVPEGRPFWKLRPLQIALTVAGILVLAFVLIGLVVSGPLAEAVGAAIGFGSEAVTIYSIAKWPLLIGVMMLLFAALYYAAPNVKQPKFRWVTIGGVVAVLAWIAASAAFGFYVSNFGSYNKTYGTLGGVISFLVWMWITNLAVLFGAELDAEVERERELEAGINAVDEIKLPPRDTTKIKS